MNDIYTADYTSLVPPSIKNDPQIKALSRVISEQLQITANQIYKNIIYARIDELDENVLDIIAYDLHIDWYDFNYPIDIKRAVIKNSVRVHKRLGTKFAVETAMRDVYPGSYVEEWFKNGGKPYTFRAILDMTQTGYNDEKLSEFLMRIWFYKNLRSHLESVDFILQYAADTYYAGAVTDYIADVYIEEPDMADTAEDYSVGVVTEYITDIYIETEVI